MEKGESKDGESVKREKIFLFFSFFASLKDLWKSDRRFVSDQKTKSIHAIRATRGYQNHSVSSNSKRYGIFLFVLFLS